jgi:hypothetical protein
VRTCNIRRNSSASCGSVPGGACIVGTLGVEWEALESLPSKPRPGVCKTGVVEA